MHIALLGIGGVGGYLGGLLAESYQHDANIQVSFLASPLSATAIRTEGLTLRLPERTIVVHPKIVTSKPEECPPIDLLICCIKSYDLDLSIDYWKSCIGKQTTVLPVLNGIDATERLQQRFPKNEVLMGCMYLVAKKIAPGTIEQIGTVRSLHFGGQNTSTLQLTELESLFRRAGIEATHETDIRAITWKKFVFIASVASITSGLNQTLGVIRNDAAALQLLHQLLAEITTLAQRSGVQLPETIVEQTLETVHRLPPETTSSMQRDILQGNRSEVQSLTGKVVELGLQYHVPTPAFSEMLRLIETREKYEL